MDHPFLPEPPAQKLAEELRRRIGAGYWGDTLPGIAKLTAELRVGRPTVEKALAMLVKSGELLDQGRRKALQVNRAHRFDAHRQGTLIVHDLGPDLSSSEIMRVVRSLRDGMPAPVTVIRLDNTLPPEVLIRRLGESDALWILPVNFPAVVGDTLHAAGRRVIHIGGRAPAVVAPRVASSLEYLVRQAVRRAFAAGHRRVCFPQWRYSEDTLLVMREWVADEYRAAGIPHSPNFDTPVVPDESPAALHACIRELFRLTPPTALIAFTPPHWIAITSTLAELKLRIPDEVSVILLVAFAEVFNATPTPANFAVDVNAYLPAVRNIMEAIELGQAPESTQLKHIWHPGGSLGPPPAGPGRPRAPE